MLFWRDNLILILPRDSILLKDFVVTKQAGEYYPSSPGSAFSRLARGWAPR